MESYSYLFPCLSVFFLNNVIVCLWLCWSSLLLRLVSSCGERGLLSSCTAGTPHRGRYSTCGTRALGVRASAAVAPRLYSTGPVRVVHGLSCSEACGICLDQGSNLGPLHRQAGCLPLSHHGSPPCLFILLSYFFKAFSQYFPFWE